jgi:hypothetical protein
VDDGGIEMAVDREEQEYHLTPNGWVIGSTKSMFTGTTPRPIPGDRVLTLIHKTLQSSRFEPETRTVVEIWRSPESDEKITQLRAQYPPPFDPNDE